MRSVLRIGFIYAIALVIATLSPTVAAAGPVHSHPSGATRLLVSGLGSGSGSTVGPDGWLYVARPAAGTITRVNPRTGASSTFATGLPTRLPGITVGGVTDVAFLGHTAYALVSVVGPDVGGTDTVGLYRIDRHGAHSVVADIGTWSIEHPPSTPFFVPSGVQYALQSWHGKFLVTDGHHNRVLQVTRRGHIRSVITFGNIVPTGIDIGRRSVYLAQAGPVPHDPADGKIVLPPGFDCRQGRRQRRQHPHRRRDRAPRQEPPPWRPPRKTSRTVVRHLERHLQRETPRARRGCLEHRFAGQGEQ